MENNKNSESVKLWARIGVTINVPVEVYQQLQNDEINSEVMKSILKGQLGEVYLDGETYFPDIEENGKLAEMDFNFFEKNDKIAFVSSLEQKPLRSFYYTFGTSEDFPYKKGWVEVQASDRQEADSFFRRRFPDKTPGVLNCSWVYPKDRFLQVFENTLNANPDWIICHEVISQESLAKEDRFMSGASLDSMIKSAQKRLPGSVDFAGIEKNGTER